MYWQNLYLWLTKVLSLTRSLNMSVYAIKKTPIQGVGRSCFVNFAFFQKLNNFASGKDILNFLRIAVAHSFVKHVCLRHKKNTHPRVFFYGVPGGDRTHNLWRRRPTLYPIELRVHQPTAPLIQYFFIYFQ